MNKQSKLTDVATIMGVESPSPFNKKKRKKKKKCQEIRQKLHLERKKKGGGVEKNS